MIIYNIVIDDGGSFEIPFRGAYTDKNKAIDEALKIAIGFVEYIANNIGTLPMVTMTEIKEALINNGFWHDDLAEWCIGIYETELTT